MKDKEIYDKYRSSPQENLTFDKGPWLKKQIESAKRAELNCNIMSIHEEDQTVTINLEIENTSENPAFPVKIDITDDGTLCSLNDNCYFHNAKEIKHLKLVVNKKNDSLNGFNMEITAWNCDKITKYIELK